MAAAHGKKLITFVLNKVRTKLLIRIGVAYYHVTRYPDHHQQAVYAMEQLSGHTTYGCTYPPNSLPLLILTF